MADIIPSADLLSRVHGEFREMPCLSLTLAQASRLFHLSETVCQTVLERLVAAGVLHARDDGRYVLRAVSR